MGCSISKIYDDEIKYEEQCKTLGIFPKLENGYLDCYGIHADLVRRKIRGENVDISDATINHIEKERSRSYLKIRIEEKQKELDELRKQLQEAV